MAARGSAAVPKPDPERLEKEGARGPRQAGPYKVPFLSVPFRTETGFKASAAVLSAANSCSATTNGESRKYWRSTARSCGIGL